MLTRSTAARDGLASRAGIKPMLAQDALDRMGDVLGAGDAGHDVGSAAVAIAPLAWSAARARLPALNAPAYRKLGGQDEGAGGGTEKIGIAKLVASHSPEEARALIGGLIVDELARVLRLPRQDIAWTVPLSETGLDSLMAVELALGLEGRFVLDAPMSMTASSFSVNELTDHIISLASGGVRDEAARHDELARHLARRHLGTAMGEIVADEVQFREQSALVQARSRALTGVLDESADR